jgi:hypothetical protein
MTYTTKAAVCSEIRTKRATQSQHHVELLNIKPGGTKETARIYNVKGLMQLILLWYYCCCC